MFLNLLNVYNGGTFLSKTIFWPSDAWFAHSTFPCNCLLANREKRTPCLIESLCKRIRVWPEVTMCWALPQESFTQQICFGNRSIKRLRADSSGIFMCFFFLYLKFSSRIFFFSWICARLLKIRIFVVGSETTLINFKAVRNQYMRLLCLLFINRLIEKWFITMK